MKAAVVRAFGKPLTIEEVTIPTSAAGQVLVKVLAGGGCHTDLHAADGDWPVKPTLPFVPGHEGAGIVAAVGADPYAGERDSGVSLARQWHERTRTGGGRPRIHAQGCARTEPSGRYSGHGEIDRSAGTRGRERPHLPSRSDPRV